MEKLSEEFFEETMSAREHAIFEVGIKLAALFHLVIGRPVKNDPETLKKISEGVQCSIACQPFVKRVEVNIGPPKGKFGQTYQKSHEFDYTYVSGELLNALVEVQYEDWNVIGRIEWKSDLNYPLMFIEKTTQILKK